MTKENNNQIILNDDVALKKFNQNDLFKQEWYIHGKTLIYIKNFMKLSIDLNYSIQEVERIIPEYLLKDLDDVFIGSFEELKRKNQDILYKDGALYISNEYQTTSESLIYCFLLGIGYSTWFSFQDELLSDGFLQKEFLSKRISVSNLLKFQIDHDILKLDKVLDLDYYHRLESIISHMKEAFKKDKLILEALKDLYITNFGIYSLMNYYIDGYIEFLYNKDKDRIQKLCPILYNKIYNLFFSSYGKNFKGAKLNANKNKYIIK
jgi:hypothetical protein